MATVIRARDDFSKSFQQTLAMMQSMQKAKEQKEANEKALEIAQRKEKRAQREEARTQKEHEQKVAKHVYESQTWRDNLEQERLETEKARRDAANARRNQILAQFEDRQAYINSIRADVAKRKKAIAQGQVPGQTWSEQDREDFKEIELLKRQADAMHVALSKEKYKFYNPDSSAEQVSKFGRQLSDAINLKDSSAPPIPVSDEQKDYMEDVINRARPKSKAEILSTVQDVMAGKKNIAAIHALDANEDKVYNKANLGLLGTWTSLMNNPSFTNTAPPESIKGLTARILSTVEGTSYDVGDASNRLFRLESIFGPAQEVQKTQDKENKDGEKKEQPTQGQSIQKQNFGTPVPGNNNVFETGSVPKPTRLRSLDIFAPTNESMSQLQDQRTKQNQTEEQETEAEKRKRLLKRMMELSGQE